MAGSWGRGYMELMTCVTVTDDSQEPRDVLQHKESHRALSLPRAPRLQGPSPAPWSTGRPVRKELRCAQSPIPPLLTTAGSPGRPGSPCGKRTEAGMGQRPTWEPRAWCPTCHDP